MAETLGIASMLGMVARDGELKLAALHVLTDHVLIEQCECVANRSFKDASVSPSVPRARAFSLLAVLQPALQTSGCENGNNDQ